MPELPLEGLTIIEISQGVTAPYTGKMFTDLAARVRPSYGMLEDSHLMDRNFFEWKERAFVVEQPNSQPPFRLLKGLRGLESSSPCLGEHNRLVFCGLLGLSESEFAELEAMRIIGNKPSKR